MDEKKEHKHLWIRVRHELIKCEHCGAVKEDPAVRQRELQESAELNKTYPKDGLT